MPSMRVPLPIQNVLIELGPLVVFFAVYYWSGFMYAVVAIMCATLVSTASAYLLQKRISWFPVCGALSLLFFGTATLFLDNPEIFIVQDTLQFGSLAVVLVISLAMKKTFLELLFGSVFAITARGWRILTVRWAVLFVGLGIANEIVRFVTTEDVWVLYKGLSSVGILLFGCWQFRLSARERLLGESNALGLRIRTGAANNQDI